MLYPEGAEISSIVKLCSPSSFIGKVEYAIPSSPDTISYISFVSTSVTLNVAPFNAISSSS